MMAQHSISTLVFFVIFQGIRTSIAEKPYIFEIFQGGGVRRTLSPPSGSAHDLRCLFPIPFTGSSGSKMGFSV